MISIENLPAIAFTAFLTLSLSGCGGGGGSSPPTPPAPPPPIADTDLEWDQGNWDEENWQ